MKSEDSQSDMQVDEPETAQVNAVTVLEKVTTVETEALCKSDTEIIHQVGSEQINKVFEISKTILPESPLISAKKEEEKNEEAMENPQEFGSALYLSTPLVSGLLDKLTKVEDDMSYKQHSEEEKDYEKVHTKDSEIDDELDSVSEVELKPTLSVQQSLKERYINQLLHMTRLLQAEKKCIS